MPHSPVRFRMTEAKWAVVCACFASFVFGATSHLAARHQPPPKNRNAERSAGDDEQKAGQEKAGSTKASTQAEGGQKSEPASEKMDLPIADSWVRVTKDYPIWIDVKNKEVIVQGKISLQRGPLEMFACPKGTKEHESVVAVDAPSRFVHMALLAVGARPGKPVAFVPEYRPASGTEVEIEVVWRDKQGKLQRVRAQELVKNSKTGKPLEYDWVFGGSVFYTDEMTGERYYAADGGEMVCVSNFANAMLDLPIESTATNQGLLYLANDEKIPPRGTPVLMILRPKKRPAEVARPTSKEETAKPGSDSSPAGKQRDGGKR